MRQCWPMDHIQDAGLAQRIVGRSSCHADITDVRVRKRDSVCISGVIMWQQRSEPSLRSISFYICMCMYTYTQTYIHIIGFLSFTSKLSILYYRCHSRTWFNKYFTVNLRPHVYVTIFTTNQNVSCLFFTDMVTREALY